MRGELIAVCGAERFSFETRQYAKRQRTWFRHQLADDRVTRVDPRAPRLENDGAGGVPMPDPSPEQVAREDRHHLLSDVRRIGRGRDGAGHRARAARTRNPLHHVQAAVPAAAFLPRIYFHEVDVGRYPLFEYPPYDLALAVRMHEVVADSRARSPALPLRDSARDERVDRQEMLRQTRPDIRVVTTLHGTDITIVGQDPSFRADHEILDREVGRTDRRVALSAEGDADDVRLHRVPHRGDSNFIDPDVYDRSKYTSVLDEQVDAEHARADAHLELPRR